MGEILLLTLVLGTVALAVGWPLLEERRSGPSTSPDAEREALEVRHRLALEALRDVEADHRAGTLDEATYRREHDEAERHAAATLRALDASRAAAATPGAPPPPRGGRGRRIAAVLGTGLALLVLAGYALPAPFGIAERDARQERIRELTAAINTNPRDTAALAELSDLYLAGGSEQDVAAALVTLVLLRDAAPESRDAHQRLVSLLVRAGLWDQAADATDRFANVVGEDDPDIPFFRGLIARGRGDQDEATAQFERFLELAPNDERAQMVEALMHPAIPSPSAGGSG
jgi:tetratricopeptide (TPR) repeat protein